MNIPQTDWHFIDSIKSTKDIFLGKRSLLVFVSGAFEPASTQTLVEYEAVNKQLIESGVDQVAVVAVNDAWVCDAWAKMYNIENTLVLPDGNGAFCTGVKAAVSRTNKGMGSRAWPTAVIINSEGIVELGAVEDGQRHNAIVEEYDKTTPQKMMGSLLMLDAQAAPCEAEQSLSKGFGLGGK